MIKIKLTKGRHERHLEFASVYIHEIYQNNKSYAIVFGSNKYGNQVLGTYKSIKRAKAVISEILNSETEYTMPNE